MFDVVPPNLPTVGANPSPAPTTTPTPSAAAPAAAVAAPPSSPAVPAKPVVGGSSLIQEEHVTVMPSKFFIPPKAKLPWKKIGLVTLVIIVGGGAIVGISMLVQSRLGTDESDTQQVATAPGAQSSTTPDVSSSVTPTPQPPASDGTGTPTQPPTDTATTTPPATPPPTTTPVVNPTPLTTPPTTPDTKDTPLVAAVDTDMDTFSDAEEIVFGTDPSNPDTDQDSFPDGKEVLNLFSPNSPDASKKLWETTVINKYHHPTAGYELLYPSAWVARATSSTGDEIVFTSPTGPSVTVSATANTARVSAKEWYAKSHPEVSQSQVVVTTKSGLSGVGSPTGLLSMFTVQANGSPWVITMQYHPAGETVATYKQLYTMMVGSLQVPTTKAFWNF